MPPIARSLMVAAAVTILAAPLVSQSRTRLVFVQAQGGDGPLLSLMPADFTIRENGELRDVVSATLASDPMRVALLVDTSEAAAPALLHLRDALQAFLRTLPPEHEIVFITTGRQLRVHVPPTTHRDRLAKTAAGIFTDRGSGNVLLDSILEADRRFLRDDVAWPVFVIVTTDGPEGSTVTQNEELNAFLQSLAARAGTVHAIELQGRGGGGLPSQIATGLTDATGGQYRSMNTSAAGSLRQALPALAEALAAHHERMSTYYRVEFRSGSDTPQPIEVGVTTDNPAAIDVLFARRMR